MKSDLTLLLFNIMGIDFGMDVEPVKAMEHLDTLPDKKSGVVWFHEKIDFPRPPVLYNFPRALHIETEKKLFQLVIDNPRDMPLVIPIEKIKPFPVLVEQFLTPTPLWAVCPLKERILLLVDPLEMCR
ncbi:MAG: hypothetical protein GY737_20215 [Desulfobacteraceae bacterium]|nr:hypothetical protein [Desulfobacteraceae bacterium]